MENRLMLGIGCAVVFIIVLVWVSKEQTYHSFVKTHLSTTKAVTHQTKDTTTHRTPSNTRLEPAIGVKLSPAVAQQKIRTCDKDFSHYFSEEDEANYEAISDKFKLHPAIESQLAYALTRESKDKNILLEQLSSEYPHNQLVKYTLLSACLITPDECDSVPEAFLTPTQEQNGAIWLMAAMSALHKNNEKLALIYLNEASKAPIYEDYWGQYLALFDIALEQAGMDYDLKRHVAAFGFGAALVIPSFTSLMKFCKNTDVDNHLLISQCKNIGKQMTTGKVKLLSAYIGLALQEVAYSKLGEDKLLSEISQIRDKMSTENQQFGLASLQMMTSRKRTHDWMQKLIEIGEVEANHYSINEAIKLSQDPNFDPCEFDW
ncbi:hypothetical protein JQC92_17010 [Shewanella sp. 202IG2-18]|uniref:hypothetical protein n=1 Tax=Parashewanella hymeniacidonis TaxID=2807618 RepID=UPI0019613C51|nr:hypothetical protein [Parashewanella hymeniacidonis]MBM7073712.1 hypothetical protein [Parashewanella hymeniacidonis]